MIDTKNTQKSLYIFFIFIPLNASLYQINKIFEFKKIFTSNLAAAAEEEEFSDQFNNRPKLIQETSFSPAFNSAGKSTLSCS